MSYLQILEKLVSDSELMNTFLSSIDRPTPDPSPKENLECVGGLTQVGSYIYREGTPLGGLTQVAPTCLIFMDSLIY